MSTNMRKKLNNLTDVNPERCKTCIFNARQQVVSAARLSEIQAYLLKGRTHICHTTDRVCRGGREFQLTVFHRLGIIEAPTDVAFADAYHKHMDRHTKNSKLNNKS